MSKPIFIIRFPYIDDETRDKNLISICDNIQSKLDDYHVLPVMDNRTERVEFECYNVVDATDKDIEEIKQMILEQLENEQQETK